MYNDEKTEKHPSYVMVGFSRREVEYDRIRRDHRSFGDLPKGAQLRFLNEAVAQGKRYGNISKEGDPLSVRK